MFNIGGLNVDLDKIAKETGYDAGFLASKINEYINAHPVNYIKAIEYICDLARKGELERDQS